MANQEKGMIKNLLLSNNFWVLNKDMVQLLGLDAAFLLSNFAEAETMLADSEGWFYQTSATVEKITTLSRYKQDQAIIKLERLGILQKELRGVPPKRYFKIDYLSLTNQFVKNLQIEFEKIDKLNCKKLTTIKNLTNKELINKESNKDIVDFAADQIAEDEFFPINPLQVIEYLNEKAGTKFSNKTKKTVQLIKARAKDGFLLGDFYSVIDTKAKEWKDDPKMAKYLRPETLFSDKFESYLNQQYTLTNQEKQLLKLKQMKDKRDQEYLDYFNDDNDTPTVPSWWEEDPEEQALRDKGRLLI